MSGTTPNCEGVGIPFGNGASGTTTFNPPLSDIVIEVFERCQKRAIELEPEHWQSCRRSMNLVQSRWSSRGVNLWRVTLISVPLVQGQIDVPVDPSVINVLDVYRSAPVSTEAPGVITDIVLYPIDRSNYASIPNKTTEGPPTSFWFERTQTPNMKLWPAVDGNGPYTLNYYVFQQMQDAIPAMGLTGDLVQRFYEAYIAEVAAHVCMKWNPQQVAILAPYAMACWKEAAAEDHEHVPTIITPDLSSYFI